MTSLRLPGRRALEAVRLPDRASGPAARPASRLVLALLCLLFAGPTVRAASIAEHRLELTLEGEEFVEEESLLVRLDSPADLETWSRYPIFLSDRDDLESSSVEVLAGGKVLRKVPRRDFEKLESPGWELYSSSRVLQVPFPGLQVGQQIRMSFKIRRRPVFPATVLPLSEAAEQEQLRVRVSGAGFRWHLQGAGDSLRVQTSPADGGVLEVVGEGVPGLDLPPWSPAAASVRPALLVTWGADAGWSGVGTWYERLSAGVPRREASVAAKARELIAGRETPRQQLEALVDFVKEKIRYEAVEIGVGGWVPTPGSEVLGRGWGDCKDKSELLVGLMAEAGLPGHLALLRAGFGQRIVEDFPSPFQFNHAIVAVSAAAVPSSEGDPVAGGYLFIDPTSERGGVRWLTPASQGRQALVVDSSGSKLVKTPLQGEDEGRLLKIEGMIDEDGTLTGTLELRLQGSRALAWITDLKERSLDRTLEDLQRIVHWVAPGAKISQAGFKELDGEVPALVLLAKVEAAGSVRGEPDRRWLRLGSLGALPGSRELEDRGGIPVALSPGFTRTEWRLSLPAGWCPAKPGDERAANGLGQVHASTSIGPQGELLVQRGTVVHQPFVEEPDLADLKELAIAENRFAKRRVRLECPEPVPSG